MNEILLKRMHSLIKTFKVALSFSLLSLFLNRDQFLKEIDCSQDRKLFPLTVDPDEKKIKISHISCSFLSKWWKSMTIYPEKKKKLVSAVSGLKKIR